MSVVVLHVGVGALALILTCLASFAVYLFLSFGRGDEDPAGGRTVQAPVTGAHRADDDHPVYGPW